jgi:hypothetical protein
MPGVFISYRREDSSAYAGRLYDRLSTHFGKENVFMDVDSIELGLDFIEVLERTISTCDAVVVVIGKQWLSASDSDGHRRLDDPEDLVRIEVAVALDRKVRVVPALVGGGRMPRSQDLPQALALLSRRNALEISDGAAFHPSITRLIEVLDKIVANAQPIAMPEAVEAQEEAVAREKAEAEARIGTAKKSTLFRPKVLLIGLIVIAVLSGIWVVLGRLQNKTHAFSPACVLPFDTGAKHGIDGSCTMRGSADSDAEAAQNEAKNNFCATGAPVNLNFANFAQLQQAAQSAGITFGGSAQLPLDRSALHNLVSVPDQGRAGEGTVVRLAAYVMDAHYSNVSNGESVNCGRPGNENNDIHIVLGQYPIAARQKPTPEQECASVTAEISPHFRPDSWTSGNLNQNSAHLFRFTGQLFFDASHRPCSGKSGASPRRLAIWEIHPVYAVDICGDPGNNCTVGSDQNWLPLSDFVAARVRATRLACDYMILLPPKFRRTEARQNRVAPPG